MSVNKSNKRDLLRSMAQPKSTQEDDNNQNKDGKQEEQQDKQDQQKNEQQVKQQNQQQVQQETDHGDNNDENADISENNQLFTIKPKAKKLPKAVTHTVISPEIEIQLLTEFDNIRSHLDYSRAELIESVIRDYVTLVKQTHPEWAEKPAPQKGRRRRG